MKRQVWMRKIAALLLAAALLMALASCSSKEGSGTSVSLGKSDPSDGQQSDPKGDSADDSPNDAVSERFSFLHNNVKITPNDLVDPLVAALGDGYEYLESESCAYVGLDKRYDYPGFSIYTYPDGDSVDHVLQLVLTDDTLATPEGLRIGASAEEVKAAYGTAYEEVEGSFVYTKGNTQLFFIMQDGVVSSIQYQYVDPNA